MTNLQYQAVGRRKESVARVYLRPGKGTVKVNDRTFEDFFPNDVLKMVIRQPLQLTETVDKFDVVALVEGGGSAGQAGAIRHGIARALIQFDAALRPPLKAEGLLTRDSRMRERKKYGQPGARKRFQFSKR